MVSCSGKDYLRCMPSPKLWFCFMVWPQGLIIWCGCSILTHAMHYDSHPVTIQSIYKRTLFKIRKSIPTTNAYLMRIIKDDGIDCINTFSLYIYFVVWQMLNSAAKRHPQLAWTFLSQHWIRVFSAWVYDITVNNTNTYFNQFPLPFTALIGELDL